MFKSIAGYLSGHATQVAGTAAGFMLAGMVGYVAFSGSFGADFFDEMAWQQSIYENSQAFGAVSYQVGEVDGSDNRIHEDEGEDEGLSNEPISPEADAHPSEQMATVISDTVATDAGTLVGDDTVVVDDPSNPDAPVVPGGSGEGGGPGGNAPGSGGEGGNTPPPLSEEQQGQLPAHEDYVDEVGNVLLRIEAEVPPNWSFAIGETYDPEGVTVTAVYLQPDGTELRRELSYGGEDGYEAFLSPTWKNGQHDATFAYKDKRDYKPFTVMGKRFTVAYGVEALDGSGQLREFSAELPGPLDEPLASVAESIQAEAVPHDVVGGFFTDLSDAQRFMVTVLGQSDAEAAFSKGDVNQQSVVFLEPLDAGPNVDLKKMVTGFRLTNSGEDPLIYLASVEDGQSSTRSVVSVVEDVPEGFGVRRVEGTEKGRFLGDQVLVAYRGTDEQIEIPMGVTKVALEEENASVRELVVPESVIDVDFGSITRCFPNLERISVSGNTQTYGSLFGVLYSADGTRMLYVPPRHKDMVSDGRSWYVGVTNIAQGAFSGCSIANVSVPASVTLLEEGCFKDAAIASLSFEGQAPVEGMASSGYRGDFFVPASPYDALCKQWVASLGAAASLDAEDALRVGVRGEPSQDGGSGAGAVDPGAYVYDADRGVVVPKSDPDVLAGIPLAAPKTYVMPEGMTAVGAGAFATAPHVREVVVAQSVQELRQDSLAGMGEVERITLPGDDVVSIDKDAFGSEGVPDIEVFVPAALFGPYLEAWGSVLGRDVAEELLVPTEGMFLRTGGALYQVLDEDAPETSALRLVEVQREGRTFFEPDGRTVEIADGAFAGCESLEIVHLPASVRNVGANVFDGCGKLESVLASGALEAFDVGGATLYQPGAGISYDYDAQTGVLYAKGPGSELTLVNVPTDASSLTVRAGTARLGDYALRGCSALGSSLAFASPETLISIGAHCFEGCSSLESADFTAFTSLETVGEAAFASCTALQGAWLPDSVTEVGKAAFSECSSLLQFKARGLSELRDQTFARCTALLLIDAPQVTAVGDECFYRCEELELIEGSVKKDPQTKAGEEPGSGQEADQGAEAGSAQGTEAEDAYGDSLDLDALTWVGDRAFAYCLSFGQSQTRTLDLGAVEHIGAQAFMGCPALRTVVLPESLTELGEEAFRDCLAITTVKAQSSLATIGRYCFYGCVNLSGVELGEKQMQALEVVGACAFANCDMLERLDLSGCPNLAYLGDRAFEGCDGLLRITLPAALTKVSDGCFSNCPNLSIVELASSTPTSLGAKVFGDTPPQYLLIWVPDQQAYERYLGAYEQALDPDYGAGYALEVLAVRSETSETLRGITYESTDEGWVITDAMENLSGHVMIASSVTAIAPEAFAGCDELEGIQYEFGATISLGDRAFEGCEGLTTVQLNGSIPNWGDSVFANCTSLADVRIGGTTGDYIDHVGPRAFANCTALGRAAFYSSVGSIDEEAFVNCTGLAGIASAAGFRENLKAVGDRAFMGSGLTVCPVSSRFPGLETIGAQAFYDCDSLKSGTVPANVTSVGEACFAECDKLSAVSFYAALEEYPKDCFKNCVSLTRTGGTAAALGALKRIGEGAYAGCTSLTANDKWTPGKYTALESIGDRAFAGAFKHADAPYSFALASSLASVGANAFDGCVGLASIELKSAPALGANAFANMAKDFKLKVPDGTYDAYLPVLSASVGEEAARGMLFDEAAAAAAAAAAKEAEEAAAAAASEPAEDAAAAASEAAEDAAAAEGTAASSAADEASAAAESAAAANAEGAAGGSADAPDAGEPAAASAGEPNGAAAADGAASTGGADSSHAVAAPDGASAAAEADRASEGAGASPSATRSAEPTEGETA
ncbi:MULTISPECIES: leucine-rich repeat domain-containing protein [unclassified Adlercreutzia]|uniref:leucine-rich repeat domain-containing protein n=1 Tax=unclassified Adlercreutzia TaxID=2636013 RepID=UPI0013EE3B88|nr:MULTISPECIES: leucine-rich repeat domain-containing protein [unclassified Adlercreutzia]